MYLQIDTKYTMQSKSYTIPLQGVDSAHCAHIIERALCKLQGVESATVEVNNNRAVVLATGPKSLDAVIKTVRSLGYEVPTAQIAYPVLGMTCASCATSAQKVVSRQPGVIEASVNYGNGMLSAQYMVGETSSNELKAALVKAGYDLLLEEADQRAVSLETIQKEKVRELRRATYYSLALALPVVVIGMFFMNMPYANTIMLLFSTPVVLYFGRGFFQNAWKQARHGTANMDTLVALSTGIAYLFSLVNMLFAEQLMQMGIHPHVYFEAAAVIIAFILLGKLLEERAKGQTSEAIKKLMDLQPQQVRLVRGDGTFHTAPLQQVGTGERIAVLPGEKIPLDGEVVAGESYVDESMLTGESIAVVKKMGTTVFAGTINQKGSLEIVTTKVGKDTLLSKIISAVQSAQGSKAPVQKIVDRIAAVFVPVVVLLSVLTFVLWSFSGVENAMVQGLIAAITVLVIACPCALGLATPTAIMVGMGKGAQEGILIKDAQSLELSKKITAVVLDKTGTITKGAPSVKKTYAAETSVQWQSILFSLEHQSEHPLAQAIVGFFNKVSLLPVTDFKSITGRGISGTINGEQYFVGNRDLMVEQQLTIGEEFEQKAEDWSKHAVTVVYLASATAVVAIVGIADQIKATSKSAVADLRSMGIEIHMLTGDNAWVAHSVADEVGIKHIKAGVLPEEKANYVKNLQKEGHTVAMVGDGINDSTALATADVSIAMGQGSDIAMDVAMVTLLTSDLSKVPDAIRLSRSTVATIRQNLFWAFVYNVIGIPIAAGILYPVNGFLLNPMLAGAAMALSSVSVVSNSLRLKLKSIR